MALSMAPYSTCCPRYTWQRSSSQISPPTAMARSAYVRAAIACVWRAAGGHDGSSTSPMPRRYCSTSTSSTRRRPPPAMASISPRYRRPRLTTTVVEPLAGSVQSVRVDAVSGAVGGGVGGGGEPFPGGAVVVVDGDCDGAVVVVDDGGAVVGVGGGGGGGSVVDVGSGGSVLS